MVDTSSSSEVQPGTQSSTLIDSASPFYIHPSDSPGMLLVDSPFDGKGYAGWNHALVIALSAKNKLGLIDGSLAEPLPSDPTHKLWDRCNDMVISWILNSLSKDIAEYVLYSRTTKEIWKYLSARFGHCNGAQLYQLQRELSDAVQGNTDIAGYFTRIKKFWDELDAFITLDHCSCAFIYGGKIKTIKSHQDGRFSLLIQDEKQREVHMESSPFHGALSVSHQQVGHNQRFNNAQNFSGNQDGRLIGFPPNFKFTKSKKDKFVAHSTSNVQGDQSPDVNASANCAGASDHMTFDYSLLSNGPSMKSPLVLGEVQDGLYIFKSAPIQSNLAFLFPLLLTLTM
ncbi:hypothetical protein KY285_000745 [Solanum tuberosum]|nr:hypothetical protein KY285_000745 [Solanum tuberosum]